MSNNCRTQKQCFPISEGELVEQYFTNYKDLFGSSQIFSPLRIIEPISFDKKFPLENKKCNKIIDLHEESYKMIEKDEGEEEKDSKFQETRKVTPTDDQSYTERMNGDNTAYILRTAQKYLDEYQEESEMNYLSLNNIEDIKDQEQKSFAELCNNNEDICDEQNNNNLSIHRRSSQEEITANRQIENIDKYSFEHQNNSKILLSQELDSKNTRLAELLQIFQDKLSHVVNNDNLISQHLQMLLQDSNKLSMQLLQQDDNQIQTNGRNFDNQKELDLKQREDVIMKRECALTQKEVQMFKLQDTLQSKQENIEFREEELKKKEENLQNREQLLHKQIDSKDRITDSINTLKTSESTKKELLESRTLSHSQSNHSQQEEQNKQLSQNNYQLIKENEILSEESKYLSSQNENLKKQLHLISIKIDQISSEFEKTAKQNSEFKKENQNLLESVRNMKQQLLKYEKYQLSMQEFEENHKKELQEQISQVKLNLNLYVKESKELNNISSEVLTAFAPSNFTSKIELKIKTSSKMQESLLNQIDQSLMIIHNSSSSFSFE